jgi:hypothetical protein
MLRIKGSYSLFSRATGWKWNGHESIFATETSRFSHSINRDLLMLCRVYINHVEQRP